MFESVMRSAMILALALAFAGCSDGGAAESEGAQLFARHCASCHGSFGEGDGPVAEVMQVAVPNLRSLTSRSGGTFPRDSVMQYIDGRALPAAHGERLMPVWGNTFSGEDGDEEAASARIAAIADFVEELQN